MRYKFFYIICFIFISYVSHANPLTGSLSGSVYDANSHKPLAKASLYIPDLKLWTSTDTSGYYSFNKIPEGNFTIEVSFVGYKSYVGVIIITANTEKDFSLSTSVIENENVTVTGVSSATQLKQSPLQVAIISKKDLEMATGTNLLESIAKKAGISLVTTGPAIAKPFIRGLGYNRVVTINDGVRQEGQQWGDEHGIEIDEYSTQRVEVLKGPASLMYGSDAIGGVLNIITNLPAPQNTIKANIAGGMNSNNKMFTEYANVAGNINGFNWNAYTSFKDAGDYKNKYDGDVLNSRFNERNFGGYVGINKGWGFSHLIFSRFDQKLGIVEGERDDDGHFILEGYDMNDDIIDSKKILIPSQRIRHTKLALDNSFSFNNGSRITALVALQRNQRQEFADVDNPGEPEAYFDLKTLNYNLAYHLPLHNGMRTSFGINGMAQKNENRAEEALIPNYNLFDGGIYGYLSKTFNHTTFSGGVRYDFRNIDSKMMMEEDEVKFDAFKKQYSNFSASVGISHEVNDNIVLKANVSRGFRAPVASELSANGVHEGTNRYEIGNKNLKSETSLSVDAAFELTTEHVSLQVAPFFNHINNYIYYEKLLNVNGTDSLIDDAIAYRYAQQSANMIGIDAGFDLHPHPLDWLHFENTFTYVRGIFTKAVDGSDNLPLIAPAQLLTELRAELLNNSNVLKNFYIKFEMQNTARQNHFYSGYNTETATAGYTLFNAGLGSDLFISGKKICSFNIAVNNIGDVAYQSHLNRFKYYAENPVTHRVGVFNMGRNFTARLIIPMEWSVK